MLAQIGYPPNGKEMKHRGKGNAANRTVYKVSMKENLGNLKHVAGIPKHEPPITPVRYEQVPAEPGTRMYPATDEVNAPRMVL